MTILIKAATGLFAGVVAGALGLAFLPRVEPNALKPRNAVEKPQFVAAPQASASPEPLLTRAAPALAVASETPEGNPLPDASRPAIAPAALTKLEPPVAAASPTSPPVVAALTKPTPAKSAPSPSPLPAVAEARASATPAQPAAPASEISARWSVRGLVALAKGDLSSARLYLVRAADEGDPRALVALADTYDPAMLAKLGVVGAPGDLQRAKDYLAKAAAAGVVTAKDRLAATDQDSQSVR